MADFSMLIFIGSILLCLVALWAIPELISKLLATIVVLAQFGLIYYYANKGKYEK